MVDVVEGVGGSRGSEGSEGSGGWVNVAHERAEGSGGSSALGSGAGSAELGVRPVSGAGSAEGEEDARRQIRRKDRAS